ncbi:mucin-5AC-like [Copidosoma floridanum]|uniref:mucin-5AC-like n=1 Tax=Copidosoma floridanum TaxID=29053 RepID=UPI000C6F93FB|nr:mucin-5AC-like [Copidosoma floridanum]
MRELDTESPVVWPAWCYTGEVPSENKTTSGRASRGEAADLATTGAARSERNSASSATPAGNTATATPAAPALESPQGASQTTTTATTALVAATAATTPSTRQPRGRGRRPPNNQNGLDGPTALQVKTERLTPDNNSTSSRSVTPSSSGHPATPPNDHHHHHHQQQQQHLKHMELMMGRNYSDFMRSLAAKYNNANPPTEFQLGCGSRNGYPGGGAAALETPVAGRFASGLKTVAAQSQPGKEPREPREPAGGVFACGPGGLFPPMLDMSSTQTLLYMVRTANAAQSAAELESYLKGASKREPGLTTPLDLSSPSLVPRKRARGQEPRRPGSVSPKPSKLAHLSVTALVAAGTVTTTSQGTSTTTTTTTTTTMPTTAPTIPTTTTTSTLATSAVCGTPTPVRCPSLCGHAPCGDGQAVGRWSVEEVAAFVSSIDICSEYAQSFREHRIDGSALPLLSEEHLTGPMAMKLGPALKLRAILARKLGACTVCLHCVHCHQTPLSPALSAAAAVAAAAAAAAHAQQHQPPVNK